MIVKNIPIQINCSDLELIIRKLPSSNLRNRRFLSKLSKIKIAAIKNRTKGNGIMSEMVKLAAINIASHFSCWN